MTTRITIPICRARLALVIALAALLVPGQGEGATRRAVLVGINTYRPAGALADEKGPLTGRGVWTDLRGSLNDLRAIREILQTIYRFPPANIRVLEESEATRACILAAIREMLIAPTSPGDTCVFYYAGHGSQVFNSRSTKRDRKDATLVPADSSAGAWDIRDKELARLFNDVIDRGGRLTVLVDACHSGSITRGEPPGLARWLPADPRDVAALGPEQPDSRPPPGERDGGAVVFSATQDDQLAYEVRDATGLPHGAFSLALARALREGAGLSANGVYLRTMALMELDGLPQDPVLAGPRARLIQPIFGELDHAATPGLMAPVISVGNGGSVVLGAGYADGVVPGCEFVRLDGVPARLRVSVVKTLSASVAEVVEGRAATLRQGDLFRLDRWVGNSDVTLRVWVPPALNAADDVLNHGAITNRTAGTGRVRFVDDPTEESPTHELAWNGQAWALLCPGGQTRTLGPRLSGEIVQTALKDELNPKVFVNVPPTPSLANRLGRSAFEQQPLVVGAASRREAHYVLAGRRSGGCLQYAWVQPRATEQGLRANALPARTDWVDVPDPAGDGADAARRLAEFARRIAAARAWLALDAPPDAGYFPYQLALRHVESGRTVSAGSVTQGDVYRPLLLLTAPSSVRVVDRRYVYAFVVDSFGKRTLLFPPPGHGNVENHLPYEGGVPRPAELVVGTPFRIGQPLGMDTYVLLTTRDPIPVPELVLDGEGARTRSAEALTVPADGLTRLLLAVGDPTRGRPPTSVYWSIQRLGIISVARSLPDASQP